MLFDSDHLGPYYIQKQTEKQYKHKPSMPERTEKNNRLSTVKMRKLFYASEFFRYTKVIYFALLCVFKEVGLAVCKRIVEVYFWVGKRGEASATPDKATGRATPNQTESSRYVTDAVLKIQTPVQSKPHFLS